MSASFLSRNNQDECGLDWTLSISHFDPNWNLIGLYLTPNLSFMSLKKKKKKSSKKPMLFCSVSFRNSVCQSAVVKMVVSLCKIFSSCRMHCNFRAIAEQSKVCGKSGWVGEVWIQYLYQTCSIYSFPFISVSSNRPEPSQPSQCGGRKPLF